MRVPFTEQEIIRMVQQRFSSTEREVRTLSHLLRWLQDQAPGIILNCRLQYQTDSQAARFCVIGVKGANECLEAVAEVYRLCALTDTEIDVVWRPRTENWQKYADALSKYEDASQWCLNGCTSSFWNNRSLKGAGRPAMCLPMSTRRRCLERSIFDTGTPRRWGLMDLRAAGPQGRKGRRRCSISTRPLISSGG